MGYKEYMGECRHFDGLKNDVCRAGVAYQDVEDDSTWPTSWPCIVKREGKTHCPLRSLYSVEEAKQKEAETLEKERQMVADFLAGLCPDCHQKIERLKQDGSCVYAEPCGHWLYQK